MDFLSTLFDTSGFVPRWSCGTWSAAHGWLHVLSDLGVWGAYVTIPFILGYFVLRREDLPFRKIFWLFAAFIMACGTTHLMEAAIFWWPAYRLAALIKLGTAVVSWATVAALVPVVPQVLAIRNPEELEREIDARKRLEQELHRANHQLQQRIAALAASEERFRLLVEGARDHAIYLLDPGGCVATWNSGAERMKQYRAEEIIGQHFSRFYPEEDRRAGRPDHELRVAAAEGRYEEEGWRVRKDGSRFWANVVVTALRDETGNLRGYSKVTRDITERRLAEEHRRRLAEEEAARQSAEEHAEMIRRQREQLRVTLQSIGDGVITTDAQGRIASQNTVAQQLTGWPEDEAQGRPLTEVFHIVNETTRQEVENPAERALREGRIVGLANHTVLISRDGRETPIDDSAAPIRDASGQVSGVVLVFRDVAERRRAENALLESARRQRMALSAGRMVAWECDLEHDRVVTSDNAGEVLGLPPGAVLETTAQCFALFHPDDLDRHRAIVEEAVKRCVSYVSKYRIVRPDTGAILWMEQRGHAMCDEAGRAVRLVGVDMDISERMRAEEALQEADRRKDEFLATLAHELRNPLAPLRNALEILRTAGVEGEVAERMREMMDRQLAQMVRLVDDLMDVSRITRGLIELRHERVEVSRLFETALESSRALLEAAGHQLEVQVPAGLWVWGDPTRLAQVISNLLSNAAKYTPPGGHVLLAAAQEGPQVVFRVRDDGIGIPRHLQAKVFEMFMQVDRSLERAQGGLGIGLTLVRRLTEMHGGTVDAHSDGPGQGSEFVVRLPWPAAAAPPEVPQAADRSPPQPALASQRVLVVDDNQDSANSLAMLMRVLGHEARTAHDGLAALEAAREFRPSVVLLDIGLPGMNGYAVARQLRQMPETHRAVLIAQTGWGQEDDRRRSIESGFDAHLVKPVDPAALQRLLASLTAKMKSS